MDISTNKAIKSLVITKINKWEFLNATGYFVFVAVFHILNNIQTIKQKEISLLIH